MRETVSFAWKDFEVAGRFRTGVCLHGHTMHSEECLSFLPRYLKMAPGLSRIVSRYEQGPDAVNFANAWWTPPLRPDAALRLEQKQIEDIGLRSIVSLTDHDSIEAPLSLGQGPVSVEWTVPYALSIFHLGVHNLAVPSARDWMTRLAAFTLEPDETALPRILRELAGNSDCLIVLNHPFWLEEGVEQADHDLALQRILRECGPWLHAFELNGTRTWEENGRVVELARACEKPLISGGDRHACEPAACINLTNAESFEEFVAEVRGGTSFVHFMPHYREPMALRIMEAAWDILRPHPGDAGRERWTDRIFYRGEDGVVRSLSEIWRERTPWIMTTPLRALTGCLQFVTAMKHFLAERGEALL